MNNRDKPAEKISTQAEHVRAQLAKTHPDPDETFHEWLRRGATQPVSDWSRNGKPGDLTPIGRKGQLVKLPDPRRDMFATAVAFVLGLILGGLIVAIFAI